MLFSVEVAAGQLEFTTSDTGEIPGGVAGFWRSLLVTSDQVIQGVGDVERLRKKTMRDYVLKSALAKELIQAQRKMAYERLKALNDSMRNGDGEYYKKYPSTTPDHLLDTGFRTGVIVPPGGQPGWVNDDGQSAYAMYVDNDMHHCMPQPYQECRLRDYRKAKQLLDTEVARMSTVLFLEDDVAPGDLKLESHPGAQHAPIGLFRLETLQPRAEFARDVAEGKVSHPRENHPEAFLHSKQTVLHEAKLVLRTALSAVCDTAPKADQNVINVVTRVAKGTTTYFASKPVPAKADEYELYAVTGGTTLANITTDHEARLITVNSVARVLLHVKVMRVIMADLREYDVTSEQYSDNKQVTFQGNVTITHTKHPVGMRLPGIPALIPNNTSAASYYAHDRRMFEKSPLKEEIGSGTPFADGAQKLKDLSFNTNVKPYKADFYVFARCDKQKLNPLASSWPVIEFGANPERWCNGQFATVTATAVAVAYTVARQCIQVPDEEEE